MIGDSIPPLSSRERLGEGSNDRQAYFGRHRCALLLVVWLAVRQPLKAQGPEIVAVRAGFAGLYKTDCWTPVEVTLRGGAKASVGQLELTVPDGDGTPSQVIGGRGHQIAVTPGQGASQMLFVKFGRADAQLRVGLRSEGRLIAEREFEQGSDELPAAMTPGQELIVMVGPPIPLNEKSDPAQEEERRTHVARLSDVSQLPTRWYGYEGVDVLILSTSQPDIYRQLSGARLEALDQWVRLGGRMVLCVGREANEILAADAPLARFAPGRFDQMIPLRSTSAIETYAEAQDRLDQQASSEGDAFRLEVPKLADVRGRIDAFEGNRPSDLPLVVRAPYGFGEVVFVALDVDRPPLSTWSGRRQLVERLLGRTKVVAKEGGSDSLGQVTRLGYSDLTGQLHSALDQFSGVQLVPFWVVAALVVFYILLIGPADYFFLKKVVRRMELTWVTFPLTVLVFSVSAYMLAHRLKGSELRLNQVDLVDVDVESQLVRGTTWSTIYSPQIETYDLALEPQPASIGTLARPEALLSWMGQPSGMGGPSGAAGTSLFTNPYQFTPQLDAIERLPISIWSTKSLVGRWSGEAASPLTSQLVDRGDRLLAGTLEVSDKLDLTDAVLIYDRWAYPIRHLQPGSTITVDKQLEPQTAETYLRHVTVFDEKSNRGPYDRSSTNIDQIMEMTLFYDLAGGEGYTGLAHRYQNFVDLSSHLRVGQAILMGRTPTPAANLIRAMARRWARRPDLRKPITGFVLPGRQRRIAVAGRPADSGDCGRSRHSFSPKTYVLPWHFFQVNDA